ncbi:MAG: type II toxin-antitoxin system RelE/ParE family toxin [Gemmataceae bacterium]|nr:type II toxin-antitoxin system RelE/ParE family toxin [Gemmataceae bacterium]
MKLTVLFRPGALEEYQEAVEFYDAQGVGLGDEFAAEVWRIIDDVVANPKRYPVCVDEIREAPLGRFPYALYYRPSSRRMTILAIYHQSRNPGGRRSRI